LHDRPLKVLLVADDKPGHYHQSEGVVAALSRLRPVETRRLTVCRRLLVPTRTLQLLLNRGASPRLILGLGYGVGAPDLAPADLVVSAGGETLAFNAAAAQLLGAANIFCGTLRRLAARHVRVVVVPPERRPPARPNFVAALPPSPFEPPPRQDQPPPGPDALPRHVGLLIGGSSGSVSYRPEDWEALLDFLRQAHRRYGITWLVTTSRRTDPAVARALAVLAEQKDGPIERFIDYHLAGPGTLQDILAAAQAALVTVDSTAMITQGISARLPVVAVASEPERMEPRELEYRDYLAQEGWYRALTFSQLSPETFLDALLQITPRKTAALDELAAALAQRLPELLGPVEPIQSHDKAMPAPH
jgi:mitochondrial fission protein ELM1